MAEQQQQQFLEETEEAYVLEEMSISEASSEEEFHYEEVAIEREVESEDEPLDYETLVQKMIAESTG